VAEPRVHIVGCELSGERVLARLARELARGTGWSLSEKPDPSADANLFLPYLLVPKAGYRDTPSLAWFTHREGHLPPKALVWDRAAAAVGLRATSARMWLDELAPRGPSVLVTPPLDRDLFSPGPPPPRRERRLRPRIGTSGFVYLGGRKGEKLWRELLAGRKHAVRNAEYVAAGRGWGSMTRALPTVGHVVPFLRGLDLYVCCSTLEGVPYGPLEALACGVPVVIPRDVGLLDSLPPYQHGIYRYERGSHASLSAAVKLAMADHHEGRLHRLDVAEVLRAATERFTAEAWCADWRAAVAALLEPAAAVPAEPAAPVADAPAAGEAPAHAPQSVVGAREAAPEPEPVPAAIPAPERAPASLRGVVCVAYGKPARDCARRLIPSVRRFAPGLPVCLISDAPLGVEDVWAEHPDEDLGARSAKTKMYDLTPQEWRTVLYLDADTWLLDSPEPIFRHLEAGWELALVPDPSKYSLARNGIRPDNKDEAKETFRRWGTDEFLQYNGGVMGWRRCPEVAAFFVTWHAEWLVWAKRDQMALSRAIEQHAPRIMTLGRPYNHVVRYGSPTNRTVVAHAPTTARRWSGIVPGRLDGPDARRLMEVGFNRHPEPPPGLRTGAAG
jgi:hypothetical protein